MVFPSRFVVELDGIHFSGDLLVDDNDLNIPAVSLTSKPLDHLLMALWYRLQNTSGFSSNGRDGSSCLGSGMGVVRDGWVRSSSHFVSCWV